MKDSKPSKQWNIINNKSIQEYVKGKWVIIGNRESSDLNYSRTASLLRKINRY